LAAQIALDGQLGDLGAQRCDLSLSEILDDRVRLDACRYTRLQCLSSTDAIDMGESHPYVLVHRYIDTGDTGHCEHSPRRKARNYITKNLATQCLNLGPGAWGLGPGPLLSPASACAGHRCCRSRTRRDGGARSCSSCRSS